MLRLDDNDPGSKFCRAAQDLCTPSGPVSASPPRVVCDGTQIKPGPGFAGRATTQESRGKTRKRITTRARRMRGDSLMFGSRITVRQK